jgi:hypothetical protein
MTAIEAITVEIDLIIGMIATDSTAIIVQIPEILALLQETGLLFLEAYIRGIRGKKGLI